MGACMVCGLEEVCDACEGTGLRDAGVWLGLRPCYFCNGKGCSHIHPRWLRKSARRAHLDTSLKRRGFKEETDRGGRALRRVPRSTFRGECFRKYGFWEAYPRLWLTDDPLSGGMLSPSRFNPILLSHESNGRRLEYLRERSMQKAFDSHDSLT